MKISIRVAIVAMIATMGACGSQALEPSALDGAASPATQFADGNLPPSARSQEDQDKPDLGSAQGERDPTDLSCAEADLKNLLDKVTFRQWTEREGVSLGAYVDIESCRVVLRVQQLTDLEAENLANLDPRIDVQLTAGPIERLAADED